jgi:hypothetical protein
MAKDDYSAYPPHAKQLATELFNEGLNLTQVVEKMRETYPRMNRITLNAWSINDEAFGVVYRNAIASKAQSVVVESMEQLEDVYAKVAKLLDLGDATTAEEKLTLIQKADVSLGLYRLLMDTARHKKTTALMLLAKINKNYSDKTNNTVAFENAPLVELVFTKPVEDGLSSLEKLQNGSD